MYYWCIVDFHLGRVRSEYFIHTPHVSIQGISIKLDYICFFITGNRQRNLLPLKIIENELYCTGFMCIIVQNNLN
jgi:hypothetical protein